MESVMKRTFWLDDGDLKCAVVQWINEGLDIGEKLNDAVKVEFEMDGDTVKCTVKDCGDGPLTDRG